MLEGNNDDTYRTCDINNHWSVNNKASRKWCQQF